jgi:hypothetical protein
MGATTAGRFGSPGGPAGCGAACAPRSWPAAPALKPPRRSARPATGPAYRRAASRPPPPGRLPADPPQACSGCRPARRAAPWSGRPRTPARRTPGRGDRSPPHIGGCRPAVPRMDAAARRGRRSAHRPPRRRQPGPGPRPGSSPAPTGLQDLAVSVAAKLRHRLPLLLGGLDRAPQLRRQAAPGTFIPGAAPRTGQRWSDSRSMGPMAGSFRRKSAVRPGRSTRPSTHEGTSTTLPALPTNRQTPQPPGGPTAGAFTPL